MIIHYKEDFSQYKICLCKPLKYSESFTFIPIKFYKDKFHKCIFQTPLLFSPFGIQTTKNNKKIIDLSFQNKDNDKFLKNFLKNLNIIYYCIKNKFKLEYNINTFIKDTDFNECLRFKILENTLYFDEYKNSIETIESFTYGNFIIHLNGLWINNNEIWFQWNLLQAKILVPIYLKEYSFIDEEKNKNKNNNNSKYDKMIKIGVPKEAVQRQKILDGIIPPPPPLLINHSLITLSSDKNYNIPKIKSSDLKSVILKKNINNNNLSRKKIIKNNNLFEPPTLEELQTTLSKLKKIK